MRSFSRLIQKLVCPLLFASQILAIPSIRIDITRPGARISPTMYGVFFEDINFGADGGLYAELVKNRSFEFDKPLRGWQLIRKAGAEGRILSFRDELNRPRNPRFISVLIDNPGEGFGLANEGFRGMGLREGGEYRFSMQARKTEGDISAIRIELVDGEGNVLADAKITGFASDWKAYQCNMTSSKTEPEARLNIWFDDTGKLDMDMVSLFPEDTWKGRKNGLRKDLVQLLAELKPGFLRFPGGCIVEGFDLSQRYQWKNTIGDIDERICIINRWNSEFRHRYTPDYFQSFGLGFFECFLLAEDLCAEPMPIINCGMACQFNSAELTPMDQLGPYIQDALDLIEFANGPEDSKWGKVRAGMGHPEPFELKLLGIGNEQWGPQYIARYKKFAAAIKEKYPDMQLIATTGSDATFFPNGEAEVEYLWAQYRELRPEIVDEHFYRKPEWFLENTGRYDDYQRDGPKLFVGEYAAHARPDNRNSWRCALSEAAFMTGMERNADLVTMSCYAPLFGNENAWQWRPDLIWFDNLDSYGSANYYVQKLFSLNKGTHQLEVQTTGIPALSEKTDALNISAVLDENEGEVVIKVVNVADKQIEAKLELSGVEKGKVDAKVIVLTSASLEDENSLKEPKKIVPTEVKQIMDRPQFSQTFRPNSLTIIRIPFK
ncbi:alpha-L-arabinofuranosidase [bacterium]|nr:alpha-L-arabinofuranosidase [bacterium]